MSTKHVQPWVPPTQAISCLSVDTSPIAIRTYTYESQLNYARDDSGRYLIRKDAKSIEIIPKSWKFHALVEHDDCQPNLAWRRLLVRSVGDHRDSLLVDTFLGSQREAKKRRIADDLEIKRLDGKCLKAHLNQLFDSLKAEIHRLESVRKSTAWNTVTGEERLDWIAAHLRAPLGQRSIELRSTWGSLAVLVEADSLRLAPVGEDSACP